MKVVTAVIQVAGGIAVALAFVAAFSRVALRYTDGIAIERSIDAVDVCTHRCRAVQVEATSRTG